MEHLSYQAAAKLQTPFFLFDEKHLEEQISLINNALKSYWNNGLIAYSFKTNSLPYLAKVFQKQGVAVEVVSEDEFDVVKQIAFWGGQDSM